MARKHTVIVNTGSQRDSVSRALIEDVRRLITEARRTVASTVNAGLTTLYWRIGRRIVDELLHGERAAYGQQIVVSLSRQLVEEYGPSFGEKNLRRMMQFAELFPQRGNCRITDTTIELDPLYRLVAFERPSSA